MCDFRVFILTYQFFFISLCIFFLCVSVCLCVAERMILKNSIYFLGLFISQFVMPSNSALIVPFICTAPVRKIRKEIRLREITTSCTDRTNHGPGWFRLFWYREKPKRFVLRIRGPSVQARNAPCICCMSRRDCVTEIFIYM